MDNEKLAGLKDKLVTYAKNLGGRKAEILGAQTNKVRSGVLIERNTKKVMSAADELAKMKLRPDLHSAHDIAYAEGGLNELKRSVAENTADMAKFTDEISNIRDSVFKARAGAGVAGAAALSGAAYAAKKYHDSSVQTQLSDRDKVAYFNPAPWADDVLNSYTQVKLVWEQKKREAERKNKLEQR